MFENMDLMFEWLFFIPQKPMKEFCDLIFDSMCSELGGKVKCKELF